MYERLFKKVSWHCVSRQGTCKGTVEKKSETLKFVNYQYKTQYICKIAFKKNLRDAQKSCFKKS